MAHSGVNPHGGFMEFVKKDPLHNIDVHRDSRAPSPDISYLSTHWAVCTQKYTAKTGKVTEDGKLDRTVLPSSKGFTWRNPTDNISFEPPAQTSKGDGPLAKAFDEMVTKPKYNINVQSNHPWVPFYAGPENKTVNNRSSVSHNIITH